MGSVPENSAFSISIDVEVGRGCATFETLCIEIDGKQHRTWSAAPAPDELGRMMFEFNGEFGGGLHRLRAVLKTSDGRTTGSDECLLFVEREPELVAPLIWALLLILLVSLSASLGWFGKPLFGWPQPPSLGYLIDVVSVVSALLIGGLLLDLGLRERAFVDSEGSKVRPKRLAGHTRRDKVLNRMGETAASSAALIIIGALPFCFALAYLVGILSGGKQRWDILTVFVAVGAVMVAVFWGAQLGTIARHMVSKLPRRTTVAPSDDVAAPAPLMTSDPKLGVPLAVTEQPPEEDKSS